jgi:predicted nucleic acid-binding protein
MILLDTNAAIFLLAGDRRARPLLRLRERLALSPIVLLEMTYLQERGRARFTTSSPVASARDDPRWTYDEPGLADVVAESLALGFTRDPFDRLIAGHALHRRWRLATSDELLLTHLPPRATLAL